MYSLLLPFLLVPGAGRQDPVAEAPAVAARIDELTSRQWQTLGITPAGRVDDAVFLRRLTLDLAGRIPTMQEARAFAADPSPEKRARAVRRLMEGPEYALHLGRVLDGIIQDQFAGDGVFLEYLRGAVARHRPWDQIFRDIMLGPWDAKEVKGAQQFLLRRLRNLDDLTTDTSRVFFGVNVSCARCHDHPLVADWKQDHYYGMASFFNRTAGKGKRGKGTISEATTGEVKFVTTKGERRTARMMFLSSKVIDESQAKKATKGKFSRREQLVRVALEEKTFFRRAIVNQLWAFFIGRGLVHPVDQMHSANLPGIPGLLEWLGDDLAAHGYDLDRLVAGIVSSRVYQLSSKRPQAGGVAPRPRDFSQAPLRPLTPQQFAVSLMLAAGDQSLDTARDTKTRETRVRALEREAARLLQAKVLDPRTDRFQSSTGEALFMSNHPDVQRLLEPTKTNLTGRLAALKDAKEIVETAVWTLLSRPPEAEERAFLVGWVEGKSDRAKACRQLVWALLTSAEFRFNH